MNVNRMRVWVLAGCVMSAAAGLARADDNELSAVKADLQREIHALRATYEARIQQLEKRLSDLEAASNAPPSAAAGAAAMNAEAAAKIEKTLQADATETREIYSTKDRLPFDATKLYDLPRLTEYTGYLRSGFGLNGEGGKMEAFKAPGAGAKYRLGNESDTYGELGMTHNWLREKDPLEAPYVRSTVMLSYSTDENFSYDSLNNQDQGNDFALRQAFIEAGNVIQSSPDIRFWAGQRYYQRHDVHINDFYYLDMSGYGGGIENVPLAGVGELSLAWLGGSVDNYQTDDGDAAKQNIDLRLANIKAPLGTLMLWMDYANTQGGEVNSAADPEGSSLDIDSAGGWAGGVIHRTAEKALLGGYNELSIQYGSGAAYNFASTLDASGPDLEEAWRFRVVDSFTIQPLACFAVQAVGLYEETDYGGPDSEGRWTSVGARPVYFFNDRFSLALEAGVDWVDSEPLDSDGHLWKITLAPQISRGGDFFSRPVIRPFVTYAEWSDGLKGQVGGTPYANASDGMSYGLQAEAWW